jgi:hypothetical protein
VLLGLRLGEVLSEERWLRDRLGMSSSAAVVEGSSSTADASSTTAALDLAKVCFSLSSVDAGMRS